MAALLEGVSDRKKKRKRKDDNEETRRKLLDGEKVEVRSTEEGFHGSWHSATIIACNDSERLVQYDHLLEDDGLDYLTERVKVSFLIEGVVPADGIPMNYRGLIRPLPPTFVIDQWGLFYGLCVDAFVNDAWWEGVVFDHEDGSDERLVLFPDLGDQQMVRIEELRVTQDWDEVNEGWKRRGDWLFLGLIEEIEQEWPVLVSVRQLWYDLRSKEGFQENIGVWTSWVRRSMWKDLVLEVIYDNLDITAEYVFNEHFRGGTMRIANVSKFSLQNGDGVIVSNEQSERTLSERQRTGSNGECCGVSNSNCCAPALTVNLDPSNHLSTDNGDGCVSSDLLGVSSYLDDAPSRNLADKPFGNPSSSDCSQFAHFNFFFDGRGDLKNNKLRRGVEVKEAAFVQETTNDRADYDRPIHNRHMNKSTNSELREQGAWLPADEDILPGAACFPDALENYILVKGGGDSCGKKIRNVDCKRAALKARMHLSYLGWKIESKKEETMVRFRYIPPNGKAVHYSLIKICKQLRKTKGRFRIVSSRNGGQTLVDLPLEPLGSSIQEGSFSKTSKQHQMSESCSSKQLGKALESDLSEKQLDGASSPYVETQARNLLQRALVPSDHSSCMVSKPHCCPQDADKHKISVKLSRLNARKKLLDLRLRYCHSKNQGEKHSSCHSSPLGSSYNSIRKACTAACIKEGYQKSVKPMEHTISDSDKELNGPFSIKHSSSAIECIGVEEDMLPINGFFEKGCAESSAFLQTRELSDVGNEPVKRVRGPPRRRKERSFSSKLLQSQTNANLHTGRGRIAVSAMLKRPLGSDADSPELKKRKETRALRRQDDHLNGSHPTRVLRSSKRARHLIPSTMRHNPRNILSWLIDNNVILPRTKVYYLSKKEQLPMAEGRITRDGIRCNCCQNVFGLTSFESHAGSTYHRPSASIFLEDGRSLLQCQKQIIQGNMLKSFRTETYKNIKRNKSHDKHDYKCSICHDGGTLLLCDQCPSSFHLSCLGLEILPEGKWFCPFCRCVICGESESNRNIEQLTKKKVLYCDQCERQYHLGCAKKMGMVKLDTYPKGNWFCSKKCEKIFVGLHKILGKAIPVGVDNLSWTILKVLKKDGYGKDSFNVETMTEHYSKLNVALAVMHECFEPIKEPRTKDLVRDVLFNKRSVLKRLDLKGFYTVLLEREDELISVATVRVYGEKVAEVPLVGTRVQFRRQGMCRIMMNVLEKRLSELGVQRLLLPAASQVLHAWTTSFGFSKMTDSERLDFLDYAFLNFQDTTMCQKILRMPPSVKSTRSRVDRSILGDGLKRRLLEIPMDVTENNDSLSIATVPSYTNTQATDSKLNQPNSEIGIIVDSIKSSDERVEHKGFDIIFKYYRRRKVQQVRNDATEITAIESKK